MGFAKRREKASEFAPFSPMKIDFPPAARWVLARDRDPWGLGFAVWVSPPWAICCFNSLKPQKPQRGRAGAAGAAGAGSDPAFSRDSSPGAGRGFPATKIPPGIPGSRRRFPRAGSTIPAELGTPERSKSSPGHGVCSGMGAGIRERLPGTG